LATLDRARAGTRETSFLEAREPSYPGSCAERAGSVVTPLPALALFVSIHRKLPIFALVVAALAVGFAATAVVHPTPAFAAAASRAAGLYYELPVLLINVRSPAPTGAVLKLRLTVELDSKADLARMERAQPRILDGFIAFLRNMHIEDFEGEGLQRIRTELTRQIDAAAAPTKARNLLFREVMLQ